MSRSGLTPSGHSTHQRIKSPVGVLDVSGKKALIPTSNLAPGRHRATRVVHGDEALGEPVEIF